MTAGMDKLGSMYSGVKDYIKQTSSNPGVINKVKKSKEQAGEARGAANRQENVGEQVDHKS